MERLEDRALLTDLTPPVLVSATPVDDQGGATFSHVKLVFDEAVATPSATNSQNYRLVNASGSYIAITAATVDPTDSTGKTIILACASQSAGVSYSVHVGGVADLAGNASPLIGRNYSSSATFISIPRAMTMGDFDNDGFQDVITSSSNCHEIWFQKGVSGGSFSTPELIISDAGSFGIEHLASADLDGDGNLDLITPVTDGALKTIVFWGNGDGSFSAGHVQTGLNSWNVAVGDLDGDSDLDFVIASGTSGFATYINPWNPLSGNPASQATVRSFETWSRASVPTVNGSIDIHIGDVNLDGLADVVSLQPSNSYPQIFLGTGIAGNYSPPVSFTGTPLGWGNVLADVTGDGRLDLVSAYTGGMLQGTNQSPFFLAPTATTISGLEFVKAADLDSDGDLDLIGGLSTGGTFNPDVYFAYNQGGGVFEPVRTISLGAAGLKHIGTVETRDINGDGLLDIIGIDITGGTKNFFVLKSQIGASAASFTFAPNHAPSPSAGGAYSINEGNSLTLNAAGSTDPDGDALTYSWDINNDGIFGDATGVSPTLTWSQLVALGITDNGSYTVAVRATDARGWPITSSPTTLTVANTAPNVSISGSPTGTEGSVYTLSLSATDDPGADTVTGWTINWGDGTSSTVSGTSATHTYADDGNYTITATATDEDGTYNAANSAVAVANVKPAPTWDLQASQTGTADITITVTHNDPAGSNDTYTYVWTITRNGVAVAFNATDNRVTFTPQAGTYSITVLVNDGDPGDGVPRSGTIEVRPFQDLYAYSSGVWTIGVSTSSAFNTIAGPTWSNLAGAPVATGDFNGDGATDLLRLEGSKLHVAIASNTSFTDWNLIDLGTGTYTNLTLGDVNGDGRTDVLTRLDGIWYVSISTGTGFAAKANWGGWSTGATWLDIRLADLDGDGNADLLGRTNLAWWASLSTGSAFGQAVLWTQWTSNSTWDMTAIIDANGDGKSDLLGRSGTNWYVALSTGRAADSVTLNAVTTTLWAGWSPNIAWSDYRVGDFDGDKRTDILARHSNGNWWAAKSNGAGFDLASVWGSWNGAANWQDVRIGDFNGDGKSDIAGRLNGNWYVSTSTGSAFNGGLLWTSGWTSTYSFIGVGNVYAAGPAGAPVANYSLKASSGTSVVSGRAAMAASTQDGSLALFWSSTKDDDRFAAALLSASKA